MSVFDEIRAERDAGKVRCGTAPAGSPAEAAAAFDLRACAAHREIDLDEARAILIRIIHRDLAYETPHMSIERATELADRFLEEAARAAGPSRRTFTNRQGNGWFPATAATFDTGVLVVGEQGAACVWVEDED